MTLAERLGEYVRACFTGIWIETHEQDDALAEIARLCRQEQWPIAAWDIEQGLSIASADSDSGDASSGSDPLAAIRAVNALATPDGSALLVLRNFHRFLSSAEIVQALARQTTTGKQNRTFVVVLSPVVQIPIELEKHFVVMQHELPSRRQLEEIARGIATREGELPDDNELGAVLDAAAGLTRYEAEGAFSLSLVRHNRIAAPSIWELKSQTLRKSGLLSLHRGGESFAHLGGLDALKSFCSRAMRRQGDGDPLRRPRGVLLLGVPGTGKSAFAKALGNETGRPTLTLDVGALMGSLVGQTESNIRQALRIADAMAPCVLFLDEVEKALSGVGSSAQTDSGVSARLFGYFLSWLNDHESDVFTIATCNDISKLPPEFSRSERFDGVYFLDLPGTAQKQRIWQLYLEMFDLDRQQAKPPTKDWTGAEIRSCCRLAALLDAPLTESAKNVVPVAATAAESVNHLRQWASGRCLNADLPGIYAHGDAGPRRARRNAPRDPSAN